MKNQQVSVDYWAMIKTMLIYGTLTVLCWVMLRLFGAVFSLPGRMRDQQARFQCSLQELQKRYPELNITEEDLKLAEKELEELSNPLDNSEEKKEIESDESKKTI